jgi:Uma2 family endonuclease
MSTVVAERKPRTFADMLRELGDVPSSRVRFEPYPATEKDILEIQAHEDRLFELVDGLLVEKAMGLRESLLAVVLASLIRDFVRPRKLGIVAGADGFLKLSTALVRAPDVSFISWQRLPGRKVPKEPIPTLSPNLAVEVLSKGNTRAEIRRKLREYFKASVELVWIVDPKKRMIAVHTSPKFPTVLKESQTLDGGDVLPGFQMAIRDLFAELDQEGD